jgi:predicted porin
MYRKLITACAACACAGSAFAQSSVTLSGIVDLAVRRAEGEDAGKLSSVISGSNSTSRLAFVGREDLGGGLGAGFHLEHGLLADSGAPASGQKFFDRRSTVSLFSTTWGELRLGRDFVPSYVVWSRHDPFAYVGVARSANLVSTSPVGPIRAAFGTNPNTTVRSDNAGQYILPGGLGGFEGGLMIAPREGGDVTTGNASLAGVRIGYAGKGFAVSAATTRSENSQTTGSKFQDSVVGGQVDFANVKVSAAWRQFKYDQAKQTLALLGATATWGPHEVKASWVRANMSGRVGATAIDANDADQIGTGYVYNFSKRTAVYTTYARISNDGAARFLVDGPAPVAGGSSKGIEVGVRHRF